MRTTSSLPGQRHVLEPAPLLGSPHSPLALDDHEPRMAGLEAGHDNDVTVGATLCRARLFSLRSPPWPPNAPIGCEVHRSSRWCHSRVRPSDVRQFSAPNRAFSVDAGVERDMPILARGYRQLYPGCAARDAARPCAAGERARGDGRRGRRDRVVNRTSCTTVNAHRRDPAVRRSASPSDRADRAL